ncbi:MAG: PorT family protein [Ignavibacteriae bacterium]|nr:PorT family protein [Ignavibacteriota bacterium]NOG97282.1 PorT family protein [Ignavibacteriota bacterium]
MKIRKLVIAVSLLLVSSNMQSQLIQSYGIKAGFNNSKQNWHYSEKSGFDASHIHSITGFNLGLFFESKIFSNFNLLTEITYLQKGHTTVLPRIIRAQDGSGYIEQGENETEHKFHYLSVPIFLKYQTQVSVLGPFLAVGPSLEYLLSYPQSSGYDHFEKLNLALNLSTGVEFSFNFLPKILIEIRYNFGLTNSFENENVTVDNRSIIFLFGIKL